MADFFEGTTLKSLLGTASGVWSDYNTTKQAKSLAESEQLKYQASLNNLSAQSILANNKTKIAIIGGAVAVIVAFFVFKK